MLNMKIVQSIDNCAQRAWGKYAFPLSPADKLTTSWKTGKTCRNDYTLAHPLGDHWKWHSIMANLLGYSCVEKWKLLEDWSKDSRKLHARQEVEMAKKLLAKAMRMIKNQSGFVGGQSSWHH